MEKINQDNFSIKSIDDGVQFLNENFDTLSNEDYREIYEALAVRFIKEEFGVDIHDINSLSSADHNELYEKLLSIEVSEGNSTPRGIMASSLVTEMEEK